MNILNDILKKGTDGQVAQAVAPQVTPQVDTSDPAATQGAVVPTQPPAPVSQLSAPIAVPQNVTPVPASAATNPWGYDAAEMEYLAKSGFTPERLERISSDFNPANYGTPQQQWYESTVTKPTIPDEKRIRNARIMAGIGDALGSIVQIAAVNGGALAKERRYEDSAMGRTSAKERELRDLYQQQLARYENGLYDAGVRDVIRGMDRHRQERAELSGALQSKYKLDQDQAQFKATLQQREAEARQRQENLEAANAEKKRVNDDNIARGREMLAQGWARVNSSNNRDTAYVKSLEAKNNGAEGYQIAFTPNPNDTDVQTDSFGEPLKFANIPQAQANKLMVDALNDADFLKKNPQYNRVSVAGEPPKSFTAAERQDILVRYYQERYNRYWDAQNTPPPIEYTAPDPNRVLPWVAREEQEEYVDPLFKEFVEE